MKLAPLSLTLMLLASACTSTLVEEADLEVGALLEGRLEGEDLALAAADEEDLGGGVFLEKGDEPVEAWVVFVGVAEGSRGS